MNAAVLFWLCLALLAYTYVGYPLLVAWCARRRGAAPLATAHTPALTVVIAAHEEATRIGTRLRDVFAQDYPPHALHVLVVDDGSRDATAALAAAVDPRVRVLTLPHNAGKAAALNAALAAVDTAFVVFADARQRFAPGALRRLLAPFADPRVGAVSGELVIGEPEAMQAAPIGLYWRMEIALRDGEARLGWLHGVTGAIHALRRELFVPLPPGLVLDDLWLPLQVCFAGRRVWMARDAVAYDEASATPAEEFRRKLRTLAGNWQLIARLPRVADPLANPVFGAWFSHKFLRLVAPWALVGALLASAYAGGAFYRVALGAQLVAWLGAGFALARPRVAARIPLLPAAGTFLTLNAAALLALPALVLGPRKLWKRH